LETLVIDLMEARAMPEEAALLEPGLTHIGIGVAVRPPAPGRTLRLAITLVVGRAWRK
jgi:hypothetical protein